MRQLLHINTYILESEGTPGGCLFQLSLRSRAAVSPKSGQIYAE